MHCISLVFCFQLPLSFQINRNNNVLKGKLAYNLTEGLSSTNPLWLVKFDDQKDEELYEQFLGKVLKSSQDDNKTMPPPSIRRARGSSTEGEQPKRVTFSDRSTASDDSSGSLDAKRVSAREQRSRRRQAKMGTDAPTADGRKRLRALPTNPPSPNKKLRGDEEVVVVNLLTGTLYLYRGAHRRAEFVRRV